MLNQGTLQRTIGGNPLKIFCMICLLGYLVLISCGAAEASGEDWDAQLNRLVKGLNHRIWYVRMGSALALGGIGPEAERAIPDLLEALEDKNVKVRCAVVRALGNMGTHAQTAIPHLLGLQESEEEWLSREVGIALARIREQLPARVASSEFGFLVGKR